MKSITSNRLCGGTSRRDRCFFDEGDEEPLYFISDSSSTRRKSTRLRRSEAENGEQTRTGETCIGKLKACTMFLSTAPYWSLFLMASIYMIGELGHFLIGPVSQAMAQDMKYGDKGCLSLSTMAESTADICSEAKNETACGMLTVTLGNGTEADACSWEYNGLGLLYQILAGPAFIAIFSVAGLGWGYLADKYNRVYFLTLSALIFSVSIMCTAFATKYWHVLLFRMALAFGEAGCSPLASGIIADLFPSRRRGMAMSIFNWGIYIGYGFSYAIGTYVTEANILERGWRASYVLSGLPGILIAVVFFFTVSEPPRTKNEDENIVSKGEQNKSENKYISEDSEAENDIVGDDVPPQPAKLIAELDKMSNHGTGDGDGSHLTIISQKAEEEEEEDHIATCDSFMNGVKIGWTILKHPAMVFLALGACVRHSAGYAWGYNSALYFKTYYPDYDVSWWLTGISIGSGAVGTLLGGYLSDRLVNKLGIPARALVLATSQLIASPFAFGIFFLDPPLALISLLIAYLAAEMWFGVMFAILVELVPSDVRSTAVAIVLFVINNFGGNVPIIVDPVADISSYRTAITIFYPGALITSSILFFICWIILRTKQIK